MSLKNSVGAADSLAVQTGVRFFLLPPTLNSVSEVVGAHFLRLRGCELEVWWRRSKSQGHAAQILCDGCKQELIASTGWASQAQSIELDDPLQVCEQHLDLLSILA